MRDMAASYVAAGRSGALDRAAASLEALLSPCRLCPHSCGVRRSNGQRGKCRLAGEILVASAGPHFGEERPLTGSGGSGTIFFSSCNLACVFCQNHEISHFRAGDDVTPDQLADIMMRLQHQGCHNINLVTPTHVVHGILKALSGAADRGLTVPLVYNSGGYESVETLELLEGIVDIYMPDIKYGSNEEALRYSGVPDYWDRVQEAVREMHRQVGDLLLDSRGIAARGLLIRHLVMPGGLAGTGRVLDFIASRVSSGSYVNLMEQYRPCFKARRIPELSRPVTRNEYLECANLARSLGLTRGLPLEG